MGKPSGIEAGLSVSDPKEYQRQYEALHPGKAAKRQKDWIKNNPEKFKAQQKVYWSSERGIANRKRQPREGFRSVET